MKVPVFLDRLRHLKFDLNSLCVLEEKFGNIEKALQELERGVMRAVRVILWAGLCHEDPDLTEQAVGEMVTVDNLDVVGAALLRALGEGGEQGEDVFNSNFH